MLFFFADLLDSEFYAKSPLTLGRAGIHAKKITEKRPAVLVLNGTGDELAPCALDELLISKQSVKSKDNFFCAYPHQSFYMPSKVGPPVAASMLNKATANADAVNQALVKDHWNENSCALCNHEHCMCSDTSKESGSQQAVDSISRLISTSPYLNALAGKEFSFDNPKSKVIVMNILFGSPLPGFDNTTQGEPEVGVSFSSQLLLSLLLLLLLLLLFVFVFHFARIVFKCMVLLSVTNHTASQFISNGICMC